MGSRRPRPVVLDAGAFIAFERNDKRVRTLIELSLSHRGALYAPASVVAQVWHDGRRQARIARLIGSGAVDIQPLDLEDAQATGVLCGRSSSKDIVDAHVVLVARREGAIVVTSDPDDLRRIDPDIELVVC
jgi:predicted nucleic acid-binding protein